MQDRRLSIRPKKQLTWEGGFRDVHEASYHRQGKRIRVEARFVSSEHVSALLNAFMLAFQANVSRRGPGLMYVFNSVI